MEVGLLCVFPELTVLTALRFRVLYEFAESQPGSDGGRLRSYRHVRAHRQSGVGLQRNRHRAATLVRHVGVAEASDRPVAHAKRSGRRRQKLKRTDRTRSAAADNITTTHRNNIEHAREKEKKNIILFSR